MRSRAYWLRGKFEVGRVLTRKERPTKAESVPVVTGGKGQQKEEIGEKAVQVKRVRGERGKMYVGAGGYGLSPMREMLKRVGRVRLAAPSL